MRTGMSKPSFKALFIYFLNSPTIGMRCKKYITKPTYTCILHTHTGARCVLPVPLHPAGDLQMEQNRCVWITEVRRCCLLTNLPGTNPGTIFLAILHNTTHTPRSGFPSARLSGLIVPSSRRVAAGPLPLCHPQNWFLSSIVRKSSRDLSSLYSNWPEGTELISKFPEEIFVLADTNSWYWSLQLFHLKLSKFNSISIIKWRFHKGFFCPPLLGQTDRHTPILQRRWKQSWGFGLVMILEQMVSNVLIAPQSHSVYTFQGKPANGLQYVQMSLHIKQG